MKKILSVNNLKVKFRVRSKTLTAIRNVDFDVYDNEIVAIVGESGSGKSVFTKTFTNMLESNGWISDGSITYYPSVEGEEKTTHHITEVTNLVEMHKVLLAKDNRRQIVRQYKRSLKQLNEEIKDIEELDSAKISLQISSLEKQVFDMKQKMGFNGNNKLIYKMDNINEKLEKLRDLLELSNNESIKSKKLQVIDNRIQSDLMNIKKIKVNNIMERVFLKKNISWLNEFKENATTFNENKLDSIKKYFSKKTYLNDIEEAIQCLNNKVINLEKIELEEYKKLDSKWDTVKSFDFINKLKMVKKIQKLRGATIATVFQDPMTSLNPLLSVGYQISEVLRKHRGMNRTQAKFEAIQLLEKVGIKNAEKRYKDIPGRYSGGMRQRVVIAIALACQPKVLICDEPTTALDVTIQAQILKLLKDLQAEYKFATVFITHDLGVVANIADRVAVMYAGQIIEYGTTKEIFYNAQHPYTWALLSALPQLGKKGEELYSIQGTPPSLFSKIKGDAYAPRNEYSLKIDFLHEPPMFKVSETHYAKTWLLDERAPKVQKPKQLSKLSKAVENSKMKVGD